MTSIPVNVQGFAANTLYGAGRVQGNEGKGDFSKIFESQKDMTQEVQKADTVETDVQEETPVKEVKTADEAEVATNNVETKEESTKVQDGGDTKEFTSESEEDAQEGIISPECVLQVAEVLQTAVSDVKELLMQELNLTVEELNTLIQDMNLTDADLLQLENVKALVMEVNGVQDATVLLTDENLYSLMKNVENDFTQIMKDVQETLQMNPQEMPEVMEQLDDNLNVKVSKEPEITVVAENTTQSEWPQVKTAGDESAPKGEQNPTQENNANTYAPQQMPVQPESVQNVSTPTASYTTVDTQNIMNQIMDFMRVQLNADSTQLDMQLHPESLGTLQIRISAKEGIMTAQFTTASENVKNVLEGQMIQLQQQFEQQNIKVDAIEVTVQTHSFESALEQGNERQTAEENGKRNRTRRIDLSRLDESEDIDAEDRVVAEMMAASGNSVDYLA